MAVVMTDQPSVEKASAWATLRTYVLVPVAAFFLGCVVAGRLYTTASSSQLPTATEVFSLRSKCAELGDQIRDSDGDRGTAMRQDAASRYDPNTNRCYVRITAFMTTATKQTLYDGQTKEILASTSVSGDRKIGDLFVKTSAVSGLGYGYERADAYIQKMMEDDRTR
jgi:hypothetical protein